MKLEVLDNEQCLLTVEHPEVEARVRPWGLVVFADGKEVAFFREHAYTHYVWKII